MTDDMKHIKQIDAETYQVRVPYTDPLTGKWKSSKRTVKGTLQQAQAVRDVLVAKAAEGELKPLVLTKPKPLKEWKKLYLDYKKDRLAVGSYETETYLLDSIMPDIEDWLPEGITSRVLDQLVEEWEVSKTKYGTTYSKTSTRNRIGILKRFLRWVFKRIDKEITPIISLEVPQRTNTKNKRTGRALSVEEARKFLAHFKVKYIQHFALVFTLLTTGQRWGSVTALRWSDIDFKGGWITFAQSHYRGNIRDGNKTGKVVRLPLTSELKTVLKEHKRRLEKEKHPNLELGLVFPSKTYWKDSPTKGYQVSSDLRNPFRTACKKLEMEPITPHDLRRTFNSWSIDAGLDGTILRSITAHSSVAMSDHYYHGSRTAKEKALENITELLG